MYIYENTISQSKQKYWKTETTLLIYAISCHTNKYQFKRHM